MGKFSDVDIDAMLKRIQDNVDKQALSDSDEKSAQQESENTPSELIDKLKAHIGESKDIDVKVVSEADDYDISGFEISPVQDEPSFDVSEDEKSSNDKTENSANDNSEDAVENVLDAVVENNAETLEASDTDAIAVSGNEEIAEVSPIENDEICQDDLSGETSETVTDIYDELSVSDDENTDEGQFDAENSDGEEEVRKRVEQYVNETLAPTEDFIFFESLDKRTERTTVTESASVTKTDSGREEFFESLGDNMENVTLTFKKKSADQKQKDESVDIEDGERADIYNELDDSDINFSISLGSNDSLESAMGFTKVRSAKHNFVNPDAKDYVRNMILNYKQGEYKSYDQNEGIRDCYRKEKKKIGRRLLFTSLIMLIALFCEIVFSFDSIDIPYVSDFLSIPLCHHIISIALLVVAISFSAKKLFYGIVGFFTTRAQYYTTVSFVIAVNILYSFLVLSVFRNENMLLFNSLSVFALVMTIIGEYMQVSREICTFNLVSDNRPKISLEKVDRSIETVKSENYLKGNDFFVENTNFVGKYFERSARSPRSYRIRYTYLTFTMLLSLLVSTIAVIVTGRFADFVLAFELLVLLCVPVQFMLLGTYQFYLTSKKLHKLDSAIIGETLDEEYVGNTTIYLDDAEVFGKHGVRVVNLEAFNSFNILDVNYYYLSVFSKIDGPLKNAFGETPSKIKLSDDVKLLNAYDGGIEALVDGKNRIFVGNAGFLAAKGVQLGRAGEEKRHEKDDTCIMFMAVNNALCAKLHLKYTITHRFEAFAEDMAQNHANVGVRTIDPNITEEMISCLCGDRSYAIKVMRRTLNDLVPVGRRSDSAIITAKNPHMISKILAEGLKIKKINGVLDILWMIYMLIGVCAVVAFCVFGIFDKVLPLYIVVYEILWTIGTVIYIINKLRNRKTK